MLERQPMEPMPSNNRLLSALPPEVFDRLKPDLRLIDMPLGKVIYESGAELQHVYFPTPSCIISMLYVMTDGASAEIAVVGDEGMVGRDCLVHGRWEYPQPRPGTKRRSGVPA